jgi:glycosyltransferase involved in cell wall biosynthesis
MGNLRIFTWHIHGTYLYYLSKGDYTIYIPTNEQRTEGYYGKGHTFPFGGNVIEVPAEEVKNLPFDCILFQTNRNYFIDQYEILSPAQRQLPRVYLEHDPPREHPTDTIHPVNDPDVIMVHVTHFNRLMWHCNNRIVKVIEHGVPESVLPYSGELDRGIVVINNMHKRGRRLGADLFAEVSKRVPLDLVGMGTKEYGGLGEVPHPELPAFISRYRFFFNPIRYTSFGLAVCEAMMAGVPIVGLATTEYATVLKDGVNGYAHTNIDYLVDVMKLLLHDKALAISIGLAGKKTAETLFSMERFTSQWKAVFQLAITNNNITHEEANSIYQ